jgi:uncharacterized protein YbjT (DUF2867 family)
VEAARRAGTRHLLLSWVIGAGEVPIGYVRAKGEAERVARESGVPFTILRAPQLHTLLLPVAAKLSSLRLAPRDVRLEPVDGDAVATRLAELALGAPSGRVADVAGPEVLTFTELVAQYNVRYGLERRVMRMPVPGALGRAYRDGVNLASAPVARVGATWQQVLTGTAAPAAVAPVR